MKKTILVLAANPVDTDRLRLDEEIREITNGLRRATIEDFKLESVLAARPEDVRRAMLDHSPRIVHFCGHGSGIAGIALEDSSGESELVTSDALSGFFRLFAEKVDCVVLNACYSEFQADAIAEHIEYVVGMSGSVDDAKAVKFAVAFYDALGAGQSIKFAFDLALNATQWEQGGDVLQPILKSKRAKADQALSIEQTISQKLDTELKSALSAYKGQPEVIMEPSVTKEREDSDETNLIPELIASPTPTLVLAQPQFGQTCLCHYMRLQAYKRGAIWVYIDAKHTNTRKVRDSIQDQLNWFGADRSAPDCILLDSWHGSIIDHANMLKCLDSAFPETPILVMIDYTESTFSSDFAFSKLQHEFQTAHLQPLRREGVRELVTKYGEAKNLPSDDKVVTKVVRNLAALNVHRTPLNCLTLLRVFERDQNDEIVNRTRLIKAVLFILFTDAESFTYASSKPEVDDCEYILGRFCKTLVERRETIFTYQELRKALLEYCKEKLVSVDVNVVIDILESNNILLRFGDRLEFKHSYWIFYFAATHMLHDAKFANDVLSDRKNANFPEIVEFYTGCDGRRSDALEMLITDTKALISKVDGKIGIPVDFNPYERIVWNPSDEAVEEMRTDVSKKVEESNLPTEIKDRHADKSYNSAAPYDQSIRQFLDEYSVLSMMQAVKAASRALRNSNYVEPELKREMLGCIVRGWESMARVVFVLAPTLAQSGRATYDGFGLILGDGFEGNYQAKFKQILLAGPLNIIRILKDDLSSGKLGPLVASLLASRTSDLQKHFLAHFLVSERPEGWYQAASEYLNLLHRNSFYLWDMSNIINSELTLGFASRDEQRDLKRLTEFVVAKHIEGPRKKGLSLSPGQAINTKNRLPIDKIRAVAIKNSPGTGKKKSGEAGISDVQEKS